MSPEEIFGSLIRSRLISQRDHSTTQIIGKKNLRKEESVKVRREGLHSVR